MKEIISESTNMTNSNRFTVVGNLVRWVKDTPMQDALIRNQFDLVMALCIEDNMYPSISPVFGQYINDNINVSDIVDFILWGTWVEDTETTGNLLKAACALLENYKDTALRLWPNAKAGDIAYRAIMFMMTKIGLDIIGDQLKYSLALSAICNLSNELLGPVQDLTSSMFSNTPTSVFDIFATEVYIPHPLPRKNLCHQDEMLEIIEHEESTVSEIVASLHTRVWGSRQYISPCSDTLKLITRVSEARPHVHLEHLYVACMAMSGLLASHQMMVSAVPTGSLVDGYQHIAAFLDEFARDREAKQKGLLHRLEPHMEQTGADPNSEHVYKDQRITEDVLFYQVVKEVPEELRGEGKETHNLCLASLVSRDQLEGKQQQLLGQHRKHPSKFHSQPVHKLLRGSPTPAKVT